jgi:hypothetical protein
VLDDGADWIVETDAQGKGLVLVRAGSLALEVEGLPAAYVPAGATCRLLAQGGVGAPFYGDAPQALRDVQPQDAVAAALLATQPRDTLVLWHLLPRVGPQDRELLAAKLAELVPPPEGVTTQAVAALDPSALRAWEAVLRTHW